MLFNFFLSYITQQLCVEQMESVLCNTFHLDSFIWLTIHGVYVLFKILEFCKCHRSLSLVFFFFFFSPGINFQLRTILSGDLFGLTHICTHALFS